MFLVTDLTIEPEAEDLERGWVDQDAVVHLKAADALADLAKRVRFSLGYELDEDLDKGEPELPAEFSAAIDLWRARHDSAQSIAALRIDTRDYQHILIPLASLA